MIIDVPSDARHRTAYRRGSLTGLERALITQNCGRA